MARLGHGVCLTISAPILPENRHHVPGKLTMKIVGWGVKAKVVFDLITSDDSGK